MSRTKLNSGLAGAAIAFPYRIVRHSVFPLDIRVPMLGPRPAALRQHQARGEVPMFARIVKLSSAALLALGLTVSTPGVTRAADEAGIVRVKSAYSLGETIARLKQDVAQKGIKFFDEIDQAKLAADAGIKLRPSTLLVFGNPPLGTQFITSNPNAGLDWPVRLLLTQDDNGDVWAVWTDFEWIAKRHNIRDRTAQFEMATK